MRILITNDDGIQSPGIFCLQQALRQVGEVTVVAPDRPRSASGHSITLHKPLRAARYQFSDGSWGYATNGTPTDCVTLGLDVLCREGVDLVVSGINDGANLGWDLTYSGTVSAAVEGAVHGKQSFAISLAYEEEGEELRYETAAAAAVRVAELLREHPLPPHSFLNVNAPNRPLSEVRGYSVVAQGRRQYSDRIEERVDPRGSPYYWMQGNVIEDYDQPGTDVHAVRHGYVAITPAHLDLTFYELIEPIAERLKQP